ncbi:MAG: hypothetical protein IKV73_04855, partial [Clostridia bacterium]|nr:hypothetical protein [Clostridia bacterium]
MKYLSRILAIFLCVTMIPISYVAQAAESDSFYEGFDGYTTNDAPAEINVNTNTYYIKEYAEGKKGLCIALGKQQTTVQFPIGIQGSFCLQFDIACTPAAADGSLTIQDNKSKAEILKFYSDNRITATDGKPLFGYGETMGRIAIVYDAQKASCDIYRDGRLFESNYRFSSGALTAIESLSFSFFSETPGNEIIIDNLYVTSGAKVPKTMPRSEYNDEVMDEPTFTHDIKLGTRVIMNCDFETALPLSVYQNGSTLERIEEDGNTAMLFERGNTGDFHLNAMSLNVQTDCVVIEFDIKILDPMSMVNFMCLDANTVTQTCARLLSGGMLTMGSQSVKLNTDTWYRFSMMINCYDRTIDYYINGEKKDSAEIQNANFVVGSRPNVFRFHVPPASSASENPVKFLTDNLRIYEGNEPREELGDVKNEIILTGKTVLPSETSTKKQMVGYYSVHARSGVAYANGTKTVLENKPYEKDGKTYVNAAELAAVFGLEGDFSGDVTVGDFAAASKLVLTAVPNSINDGLYIFGKSSFKIPDNEEDIDKLNDYLFFQRPIPEQVTELFNSSPVKGVHPRIQATADDFARIREQVKTDSYMKLWSERIIRAADALFTKDP